uniref:Uncharacterized protein n=1 Tax=Myoviridae sp. ct2Qy24 TaxID=2827656 RepID=A0A8S5STN6_9CAUD|nr:MAG TPA: hypothetical protein [Myoviridae sp. ct2Qy24]
MFLKKPRKQSRMLWKPIIWQILQRLCRLWGLFQLL